jgi:hypothetical protein
MRELACRAQQLDECSLTPLSSLLEAAIRLKPLGHALDDDLRFLLKVRRRESTNS